MDLHEIDFADANFKRLNVEYDKAEIFIQLDDEKERNIVINCYGLIGINNLCIWDDTYIDSLTVTLADKKDEFLKDVFKNHALSIPGRDLTKPIYEMKITFVNNIICHIYFQAFEITDI